MFLYPEGNEQDRFAYISGEATIAASDGAFAVWCIGGHVVSRQTGLARGG